MRFVVRHLDPGSRMLEILFGLIMTLTFTLGAGMILQEEGRAGARELLIATAGCNLAWGVIDGIFYVLGELFERGRRLRIAAGVRAAADELAARKLVADEFDESLEPMTDMQARDGLYGAIARRLRSMEIPPVRVRREDLMAGLASGWLVFACSFPAALPFAFIDEPHLALRVSNVLLLGLLFLVGYQAGKRAFARPWLVGSVFLLVGLGLVAGTIALGG
jgi:VIT1/CCC1 family predicted Fe2+/Mn2+ transporter